MEINALLNCIGVLILVDDHVVEQAIAGVTGGDPLVRMGLDERQVSVCSVGVLLKEVPVGGVHFEQSASNWMVRVGGGEIEGFFAHAVEESHGIDHGAMAGIASDLLEVLGNLEVAVRAETARLQQPGPILGCVDEQELGELVQQDRGSGAHAGGRQAPVCQEFVADRVDCTDRHLGDVVGCMGLGGDYGQQTPQTFTELVRALLCEGAEEDALWRNVVEGDQVQGSPDQNAGLAAAGAGGQIERAGYCANGLLLVGVGVEALISPKCLERRGRRHVLSILR